MPEAPLVTDESALADIVRNMRTVAVIGMKDEKSRVPAFEIPQVVQARGVRVIPVNPALESSLGEKSYPDLASIPDRFDTVNVFRRPDKVMPHAEEILALPAERRPSVVWMQTGVLNEEAAAKLSAAGIQVVMDRCLGVYASRYLR